MQCNGVHRRGHLKRLFASLLMKSSTSSSFELIRKRLSEHAICARWERDGPHFCQNPLKQERGAKEGLLATCRMPFYKQHPDFSIHFQSNIKSPHLCVRSKAPSTFQLQALTSLVPPPSIIRQASHPKSVEQPRKKKKKCEESPCTAC